MNIVNFDASSFQHVQMGQDMYQGNVLDLMLNEQNAKQCTHHLPYAYIECPVKIGSQEIKGVEIASPAEAKLVTGIPVLQIHINPLTTPVQAMLLIYTTPEDSSAIRKAKLDGNLQTEREIQSGDIKIFNMDPTVALGKTSWITGVKVTEFKTNIAFSTMDRSVNLSEFNFGEGTEHPVKGWSMTLEPPQDVVTIEQDFGDSTKAIWKWRAVTAHG